MANNTKFWLKATILSFLGTYLVTAFVMDDLDTSCWSVGIRVAMLWVTVVALWIIGLLKYN